MPGFRRSGHIFLLLGVSFIRLYQINPVVAVKGVHKRKYILVLDLANFCRHWQKLQTFLEVSEYMNKLCNVMSCYGNSAMLVSLL